MAISTAAAIIGGSVLTGVLGAKSAKKSAAAGAKGQEAGIAEQRRQFDITQGNIQPGIETGNLARERLAASLGLSGTEAEDAFFASRTESAGQRFLRERGEKSVKRNAAALGQRLGGNLLTALQEQGIGFASQNLSEEQNRLASLAGSGQTAAANLGSIGSASASNIQQGLSLAGQSRASGITGANSAIQTGISGVATGLARSGVFTPPPPDFNLPASNIDPFARTA